MIPKVSIEEYIQRFFDCSVAGESLLVYMFINLDKLIQKYTQERYIVLSDFTKHRILLSLLVLCHKILEDDFWENKYYSQIGGITLQEMNYLELKMLELLNYRLMVSLSMFESVLKILTGGQ